MNTLAESSNALSLEVTDSLIDKNMKVASIALGKTLRVLPERRMVYRGNWQNKSVILKRYLSHPRQWHDFQREWTHLKKLHTLGLQTPEPLFVGKANKGDLCIVMDAVKQAVDLQTLLFNQPDEPPLRTLIFQKLMIALAQQHAVGVYQNDHHLGNWLWDGKTLYAVDASSFCFGKAPLSLAKRAENLAWLFVTGKLCWEEELEAVLPVYLDKLDAAIPQKQLREKLLKKIPRLRKKRLLKYLKKTNRSCGAFEKKRFCNRTILWDCEWPSTLQKMLCENPDQLIASNAILKNGNTCTVASFVFEKRHYVIKRYNPKSFIYRLRHCFFPSRARRSWSCGLAWSLLGLPSPRPYACVEEREAFLIKRAFVVFEKIEGERLDTFVSRSKGTLIRLNGVAEAFSRLWQSIDKVKAIHGDMKASNFLVSDNDQLLMIDFDHFRFFVPALFYQRKRRKEWKRFMENWKDDPTLVDLFAGTKSQTD